MSEANGVVKQKAKYASTMKKEFENNVQLLPNEIIELKLTGILLTGKYIKQNPGYIGVTNKRFIFLIHRAFGPDYILYIPFSTIIKISVERLRLRGSSFAIHIDYKEESFAFYIIANTFLYALKMEATASYGSEETFILLRYLLEKLPQGLIDQSSIPNEYWEYLKSV